MKSKGILKKVILVAVLAALVFGAVNLFWYGFKYLPYKKMADRMQFNNDSEMPRYVFEDDKYLYRLKMPRYLSFDSGFLYVGPNEEDLAVFIVDEEGNLTEQNVPHVDMFIWPKMFSETVYGVTIYEKTSSRQLIINRLGEYLPDEKITEEEKAENMALFEQHKEEIRDMLQAANELWRINQ